MNCPLNWLVPDLNFANETLEDTYSYKKKKVRLINNFIKENNYEVVWENDLFQILSPIDRNYNRTGNNQFVAK